MFLERKETIFYTHWENTRPLSLQDGSSTHAMELIPQWLGTGERQDKVGGGVIPAGF